MASSRHVVGSPEDVLVAVSSREASEELMRRGARLARRRGGSCLVVTVQSGARAVEETDRLRALADQLGCAFAVLGGRDVAGAVIQGAQDFGAEHVVVLRTFQLQAPHLPPPADAGGGRLIGTGAH